jgi:Secretion system C-terminal sorting domain/Domain of unknown function DUF11
MAQSLARLTLLFLLSSFTNSIFAQYIPDISFRRQIRAACPDCIDASNNLLPAAQNLGYLDIVGAIDGFPMRNIQGIEGFTRLKTLNITDALALTNIDILPLQLTNLNISNVPLLSQLDALPLQLTNLYIYNAPSLNKLNAFLSDSITKLSLINVAIDSIKQVLPKELIDLYIKDDSLKYIKVFSNKIRNINLIPQSYLKSEGWTSTLTLPTKMPDSLRTATIRGWQFTNKTFQFPDSLNELILTHTNLEIIDFLPKKFSRYYAPQLGYNTKLRSIKFPEESLAGLRLDSTPELKCLPPLTKKCFNIYPLPSDPQAAYKCFVNNPFSYNEAGYETYQKYLCAKNNPNRCYTTKTFISGRITHKGQDSIVRFLKAIIKDSANRWVVTTLDSSGFYTAEIDSPMVTTFSPFANIPGLTSVPIKRTIDARDTIGANFINQDFIFGGDFTDAAVTFHSGDARPGFSSISTLRLNNWGTSSVNGKLTLTIDPKQTYEIAYPPPTTIVGNVLTWLVTNVPSTGSRSINITLKTLVNAPLGSYVNSTAVLSELNVQDLDTSNNRIVDARQVRGSYDPNDITVDKTLYTPKWGAPQNALVPLIYTIRFQNTGNADAINVVVVDTIPDKLDIASYQEFNKSHDSKTELIKSGNNTIIRWTFNYIYLPAASINEKGSHGFITFKLNNTPSKTNYARDSILNKGAIYFDFNPPIITNTAKTTFLISAMGEIGRNTIKVYPNPTHDLINIDSEKSLDGIATFTNLMGQIVAQKLIVGNSQVLSMREFPKGLYIMTIKTKEGQWSTKVLKQDAF